MEYLLVPNFLENVQEKLKYEAFLLRISNLSCIGSLLPQEEMPKIRTTLDHFLRQDKGDFNF